MQYPAKKFPRARFFLRTIFAKGTPPLGLRLIFPRVPPTPILVVGCWVRFCRGGFTPPTSFRDCRSKRSASSTVFEIQKKEGLFTSHQPALSLPNGSPITSHFPTYSPAKCLTNLPNGRHNASTFPK